MHENAQVFLWDTEVPGLAVRATAGAKAYIFQGKPTGRDLRLTIGDVRVALATPEPKPAACKRSLTRKRTFARRRPS